MIASPERLDALLEPMLREARIPGIGLGIVAGDATFCKGYGYRDLPAKLPLRAKTAYPIASTSKAMNATLLGTLVDQGVLAWDEPVQRYLPRFFLKDASVSSCVTLRDLLVMRTGLPRHDWVWNENPIARSNLVESVRHLELSAGFRERFQYNNLTATIAGHIAEVVTGRSWEELIQHRLLQPLRMAASSCVRSELGELTCAYHENDRRELVAAQGLSCDVLAPAGAVIHSTIEDMVRWVSFNLGNGTVAGLPLVQQRTLAEIHKPQIGVGNDPSAPSPNASYAMGWFVDAYNGYGRVSHGGYLHDVHSSIMLFPAHHIGIVSYCTFGPPPLAKLINEQVFDLLMGLTPVQNLPELLAQYEQKIVETRKRNASSRRVPDTTPSHPILDYVGQYAHPAYGGIEVRSNGRDLVLHRGRLVIPLRHWHYDAWVAGDNDLFFIHAPHPFDPSNRVLFEMDADGVISALAIRLEASVAAIKFLRS